MSELCASLATVLHLHFPPLQTPTAVLILFQLFDSLTQSNNLSVFLLLEKVQLLENRVQPRNRISSWSV